MRIDPAFLFDLDGTLVDSVYQHVLAWKAALDSEQIELSVWRIHRRVGMSGGLFANQLLRETGIEINDERVRRLCDVDAAAYLKTADPTRTPVVTHEQVKHAKPDPNPAKMVKPYVAGES